MGHRLDRCVSFKGDAAQGYAVACVTFQSKVSQGYASDAGQGLRHHLPPAGGAGDATHPPLAETGDAPASCIFEDSILRFERRVSIIETVRSRGSHSSVGQLLYP